LTVLFPALNEESTISACVTDAVNFIKENEAIIGAGEVLVVDNNSTDNTAKLAADTGAAVIFEKQKGYGAALKTGIRNANGKYVVMLDADCSYSVNDILPLVKALDDGNDLVVGNRYKGGIEKGAMPFLHRNFGTPILSFVSRLLFKNKVGDYNCGIRAFRKDVILGLNLQSDGMQFASEMIIKASIMKLKIAEVPVTLSKDKRPNKPHLKTFRDGWRHIKLILAFSPMWLYFLPAVLFLSLGFGGIIYTTVWYFIGTVPDIAYNRIIFFLLMSYLGFSLLTTGWIAKAYIYSITNRKYKVTTNRICWVAIFGFIASIAFFTYSFVVWGLNDFGSMLNSYAFFITLFGFISAVFSLQLFFMSFIIDLIIMGSYKGK
jgi:glycosyltransferase involved in cell wall biosynthesis